MRTIKLHNMGLDLHRLPTIPNFIRRLSDDFPVPIWELSDAQLKKIGREWTNALIEHAQSKRKDTQ
jgi:hypothetical protein